MGPAPRSVATTYDRLVSAQRPPAAALLQAQSATWRPRAQGAVTPRAGGPGRRGGAGVFSFRSRSFVLLLLCARAGMASNRCSVSICWKEGREGGREEGREERWVNGQKIMDETN